MGKLKGDAALVFLKEVFNCLKDAGTFLTSFNGEESGNWEAVVKTQKGFEIEFSYSRSSHQEEDPDPRGFGDTQAVTAAAMSSWFPGKTYTVEDVRFSISANGFSFETTYISSFSSRDFDTEGSLVLKIRERVFELRRLVQSQRSQESEKQTIEKIRQAFS